MMVGVLVGNWAVMMGNWAVMRADMKAFRTAVTWADSKDVSVEMSVAQ